MAAWKERGGRGVARVAAEIIDQALARPPGSLLTWVPPDPDRSRRRGHHPAQALGLALAERWALVASPTLTRLPGGRRQAGLTAPERRRNVQGVFLPKVVVAGEVVLIDDVFTTGATVAACADALTWAGASRVDVITFARAMRFL